MAVSQEFGAYLPTTDDFDIDPILESDLSEPLKDLLIRLYQSYNDVALITNIKDSGYYLPTEFVNGQQWFGSPSLTSTASNSQTLTTRQVYRQVINFGALLNTAAKSVAHGIVGISTSTTFTRIYGVASDTTAMHYIPLPYVSVGGGAIELEVDSTNVTVTTASNRTSYNVCYIVLEYLKN